MPVSDESISSILHSDPWIEDRHLNPAYRLTPKSVFDRSQRFLGTWSDLKFGTTKPPPKRSLMSDQAYYAVPSSVVINLKKPVPLPPPTVLLPELTDCDDYALALKVETGIYASSKGISLPPPAIGLVISKNHALCMFVAVTSSGKMATGICDPSLPNYPVKLMKDSNARALFREGQIRWLFY